MPATLKLPEIYKIADKAIPTILKGNNSITNAIRLSKNASQLATLPPVVEHAIRSQQSILKYSKSLQFAHK